MHWPCLKAPRGRREPVLSLSPVSSSSSSRLRISGPRPAPPELQPSVRVSALSPWKPQPRSPLPLRLFPDVPCLIRKGLRSSFLQLGRRMEFLYESARPWFTRVHAGGTLPPAQTRGRPFLGPLPVPPLVSLCLPSPPSAALASSPRRCRPLRSVTLRKPRLPRLESEKYNNGTYQGRSW